ncbi:EAL domain-containing protein [uncultured Treponema sp.]|uniref:EAL domain-containing protein n=1 Tax=uncultured Treponema sp. TaxID=162155 RepID=UPI0025EA220D|nr:EAL domain-containing protein [uncultured Treponema sp.]
MKKKFYINSNTERFFSFAVSLVLILVLNIVIAKTLLTKIEDNHKANFISACDEMVEDYAFTVDTRLRQLESRLDLFYAKIAYKNLSIEKIQELLLKEQPNIKDPFTQIVYADKNGNSWNALGHYYDVTDREYFEPIISGKSTFYVSNILESKEDGLSGLSFVRPIYSDSHEVIGMLMATCPINKLAEYFEKTNKRFAIQDKNKKLILHYEPKWINWVYSPWKYADKTLHTPERDYHVKESSSTDGKSVYVFYRQSEVAPWTISYSVPAEEFTNLERAQKSYQNFLIEIIVVVLSLIFLLEIWVHSFLERHQLLSTNVDSLTHLWVRSYFEKEANKLLKRYPNSKFMLIDSDIRGFKFINQQYGEAKANKLLFYFSKLLYENTKLHDGLLSRDYADHFCVFIKVSSIHKAMHFFKTDLEKMNATTKNYDLPFMPKFGIAFYAPKMQDEIPSVQLLISRASFAKSTIKENALQQFAIYDEKLLRKSKEENFIETHMESALLKNEFFVMYQPKIALATERVVGAEALVRWQSPELGYMPPNSFVPLFERNNFIIKLDFYVYEQVFKFLRKCLDENEPIVPISVNVSRNHDKPEKFVHDFTTLLKKYEIPSKLVEVELLERATLDKNLLREITVMLQKEGLRVAMDDFGSGESSLNMLSTIPVNILKFDRSFLFANDAERGTLDETSESFIETLVDLGKNLKKETIFEGVETEEQRDFLRKIKCDQVQGYFYSKPLKEDEFMEFLKKHR